MFCRLPFPELNWVSVNCLLVPSEFLLYHWSIHSFLLWLFFTNAFIYKKSESKPERDTKQLKTNAFVPFFNTLFETSVIYILWLLVRFGQKAGNYELVIAAARHYWNAIKPFIVEPIERELLREPMEAVLECIAAVAANEVGKEDEVRRKCL